MSEAKATARPWGWQKFGDQWCLTGQHGMRPIVMAVRKGKLTSLVDGLLVPFDPKHPDAALIVESVNAHDSLLAHNKRLTEALKEIASDCEDVSRVDGVSKGELRAWRAIEIKVRNALAENKGAS